MTGPNVKFAVEVYFTHKKSGSDITNPALKIGKVEIM
jgi:hypothetical protein|tara:strand:- start:772 stop:882 length:111 start_codon:yes stop_codon:yes gene_type:complete